MPATCVVIIMLNFIHIKMCTSIIKRINEWVYNSFEEVPDSNKHILQANVLTLRQAFGLEQHMVNGLDWHVLCLLHVRLQWGCHFSMHFLFNGRHAPKPCWQPIRRCIHNSPPHTVIDTHTQTVNAPCFGPFEPQLHQNLIWNNECW